MRPGTDKSALKVIQQDQMTVGELEALMRETNYNGFPVVVSEQDMLVAGFCTRNVEEISAVRHVALLEETFKQHFGTRERRIST